MSSNSMHADVIIVGGGLIGSILASKLAKAMTGIEVVVLEAAGEPPVYSGAQADPRVVALNRSSQSLLQDIGVWDQILTERACPYYAMCVWEELGTAGVDFSSTDIGETDLGHIVENSIVVRACRNQLLNVPTVTLLTDVGRVTLGDDEGGDRSVTLADGRRIFAPLIIAADGAESHIRSASGIAVDERDYGHVALVATVRTEFSHEYTAWQKFLDDGPLAFLPLSLGEEEPLSSHYSSIVWSCSPDRGEALRDLGSDDFCRQLSDTFEHRLGKVLDVSPRHVFHLRARHAERYHAAGVVLVGDAAHTIHPLAGQGVNLGLKDVRALVDELQRGHQRGLSLRDSSVLARYQRRRRGDNLLMLTAMEGFKQLYGADAPALRWIRNAGMRGFNRLAPIKHQIMRRALDL